MVGNVIMTRWMDIVLNKMQSEQNIRHFIDIFKCISLNDDYCILI